MNTTRSAPCIIAATLAFAPAARADVLLDEPFTYADGQLTSLAAGANVSGGNWYNLSGTGTPLQVLSGAISGVTHGSGSREDASRDFAAANISSGELFAAFDLTVTSAPTALADYFLALHPLTNSTFRGRVFIAAPAVADPSMFRLGVETESATSSVFTADLPISQTYSILLRVALSDNASSLWVNTSFGAMSEASPTISDAGSTTVQALGRVVIRQGGNNLGANAVNLDNLKIADNFAQAIPEPGSALLLLGGLGMLGIRRRRG